MTAMKKRADKKPLPAAMELLERNYERIVSEAQNSDRSVGFLELSDAIQETAILIITDTAVLDIHTDREFREYFAYRLRMIRFRIRQDYALEKRRYANYQPPEEEE